MFDFRQWFRKTFRIDASLDGSRRTTQPLRSTRRNSIKIGLEALEDRVVPSISYQGGPVMTDVNINNVYYGSFWNQPGTQQGNPPVDPGTTMNRLDDFTKIDTTSSYWSMLNQYTMKDPHSGQVTGTVGPGTFGQRDVVPTDPDTNQDVPNVVGEKDIQDMLVNQINHNKLPLPSNNQLYMVYLPRGVFSLDDLLGLDIGHHSSFTTTTINGTPMNIIYGVVDAPSGSMFGQGYFDAMTQVASHEIAESATDPLVGKDPSTGKPNLGWADLNAGSGETGEIGDYPAGTTRVFGEVGSPGDQYTVQALFSVDAGQFLPPPPDDPGNYLVGFNGLSNKQNWGDASSNAPVEVNLNGQRYIAWTGRGNNLLNIMHINDDGTPDLASKFTSGYTAQGSPALVAYHNYLRIAWTGLDHHLYVSNVETPVNGQINIERPAGGDETTNNSPALVEFNDGLYLAWTGRDNNQLNIEKLITSSPFFANRTTFSDAAQGSPALAVHNGQLYVAWTGLDGHLNVGTIAVAANGSISMPPHGPPLGDLSYTSPSLASIDGSLVLAWSGVGNNHINVMRINDNGSPDLNSKYTSPEISNGTPALVALGNELDVAWTGIDGVGHLNLASVDLNESNDKNTASWALNNGYLILTSGTGGTAGSDTFTITYTNNGELLVNEDGAVSQFDAGTINGIKIEGLGGNNTLNVVDQTGNAGTTYTVSGSTITADDGLPSIRYQDIQQVSLNGESGGGDHFIVGDGVSNLDGLPSNLTLHGSGGSNSLTINDQPNASSLWLQSSPTFTITASAVTRTDNVTSFVGRRILHNTYTTTIGYSGMNSLEVDGGSSGNTFNLNGAPSNFTLHGGSGNNTLNYSGFHGDVLVDLPLGIATGVSGGISNIQNVIGSQGNSILVGNGGDVLTGGTGRNLLIAGKSPSTLVGNSDEDILVGGTTSYDNNVQALDALMAEWTRTDKPYAARVQDLLSGGGLNGTTLLNVAAFHSNGGGNTLTGNTGLDLFYGLLPADSNTPDTTDWNAAQGEVFIDPNGQNVGVLIDATKLSAPTLLLDGTQTISDAAAQWVTLQPGTHELYDPEGTGTVSFTVNADGTISYDPALAGILSGQGTNQLTINGAQVTVDATALTTPTLLSDYRVSETTSAAFTLTLLPGLHILGDPEGTGSLDYTVNPDGSVSVGGDGVSYASSIASVSNGNQLTLNGAQVTVDATALQDTNLTVDYQTQEQTAAPFTVYLLPGTHELSSGSGSVSFTVNPDGTLSYPSSEDALLFLQGSMILIVKALH